MRRSAWIFFASIFLPSLGLAWLAIRSVQDQQVVLEHQQVIISQNITDTLAQNVQAQMDAVRADFVATTQQLLKENASPENLARDFNRQIRAAWPMAQIGFAVNLDGQIYSPKTYDGQDARTFRNENDRFLSNHENVEVYSNSFNASGNMLQNSSAAFGFKNLPSITVNYSQEKTPPVLEIGQKEAQAANAATITKKQTTVESGLKDEALRKPEDVAKLQADLQVESADSLKSIHAVTNAVGGAISSDFTAPASTAAPSGQGSWNARQSTYRSKTVTVPAASTPADSGLIRDKDDAAPKAASVLQASAAPAPALPPAATVDDNGAAASTSTANNAPMTVNAPTSSPVAMGGIAPATPVASTSRTAPSLLPGHDTDREEAAKIVASPPAAPVAAPAQNEDLLDRAESKMSKVQRQVIPQRMLARDSAPVSNTLPADSDFRRVIGADTSGELARFLENKLRLIVWSHATPDAPLVFGAQLDTAKLIAALQASLQIPEVDIRSSFDSVSTNYCTAILDDTGRPVALSRPGFVADWKHPFVATEIGEVLPHWEAALYQVDPRQIGRAARTVQLTLGLIVLLLVAAIVAGGSLIAADVRKQVRLAQQKTDFVSNVSHELKTPLTSIRMFADLLAEKRVPDEERQATYLRIIAAEASRLTRLINNVLDFARLERGAKVTAPGEHRACDLVEAVRDVIDTCGPHLEAAGITFRHEIEADSLPIRGDRDALAQIILNLVSNAEKYGGGDVLVRARRQETATGALGCIDVLDRGTGIPPRQVRTIFEPFQRLDDSLASGIPGSGLGLTLARRMARAHGGDVSYSARAGGGSCFTLTIPLETAPA